MADTIDINHFNSLNIHSIPEEYRPTWNASMIEAITQPTAGLAQFAPRLTDCTGEYIQMQSIGAAGEFTRRKQRHEKKMATEPNLGRRRIYPVAFGKTLKMSKDDFTYKGGLPITLNTLHSLLNKSAAPVSDRVFLGVQYDENLRNCVVASLTDGSPYWNDASDGINTDEHDGQPGGIMGPNKAGQTGDKTMELPKHPLINGVLATAYDDYKTDLAGLDLKDTNIIPVNYMNDEGTVVDSGMTIEKLQAARLSLILRHAISPNTIVNMAVTPWQIMDLVKLDKLQNSLYGFQSLKDGWISELLGIRFHVTADVPIVNIGTTEAPKYVRACPMWLTEDVEFGIWKNPEFEIEKLSGYWDTMLVSLQFAYGAGRKREETVIIVHCDEKALHNIGNE